MIVDSGLHEILKVNKFTSLGTSSIVDVNDIKRVRYCLQLALCAFYVSCDAHQNAAASVTRMEWLNLKSKEREMCLYWHLVLNMQLQILTFIRTMCLYWHLILNMQLQILTFIRSMCLYWHLILNIQLQILTFIRSMCVGNFKIYVESMKSYEMGLFI